MYKLFLLAVGLFVWSTLAQAAEPIVQPNDRIIWIGNTFTEREPRYGYWELEATRRLPKHALTFRNLGWSGDTVWGEARAGFDNAEKGYQRLIELAKANKPNWILVSYGHNESYAGTTGLQRFTQSYEKLLRDLAETKSKFILITPPPFEANPLTETEAKFRNEQLALYCNEIRQIAKNGNHLLFDLNQKVASASKKEKWTENGIHFSDSAYQRSAIWFGNLLTKNEFKPIELLVQKDTVTGLPDIKTEKVGISQVIQFTPPMWLQSGELRLKLAEANGAKKLQLQINNGYAYKVTAEELAKGMDIPIDLLSLQSLRETILKKNELYFHRWRPQNETYLFGFRKHEQGRNAAEIVQFDPLIDAEEKQIQKLAVAKEIKIVITPAN